MDYTSRDWQSVLARNVHRTRGGIAGMSVKNTVLAEFAQVAKEQNKKLAPLTDDLVLLESGLDSLCFAIIVARLEDALGIDPFGVEGDGTFPVTLGDFVRFYADAAR